MRAVHPNDLRQTAVLRGVHVCRPPFRRAHTGRDSCPDQVRGRRLGIVAVKCQQGGDRGYVRRGLVRGSGREGPSGRYRSGGERARGGGSDQLTRP
jgi:hypothetical protein